MAKHRGGRRHRKGGKGGESAGPAPPNEDTANLPEQAPLSGLTPGESVTVPPSASRSTEGKGKEPAGPAFPNRDDAPLQQQAPLAGLTPGESAAVPSVVALSTAPFGDFHFSVASNVRASAELVEAPLFLPLSAATIPAPAPQFPLIPEPSQTTIAPGAFSRPIAPLRSRRVIAGGTGAAPAPTSELLVMPSSAGTKEELDKMKTQINAQTRRIQELQIEKQNAIKETKNVRETRNAQKTEHDNAMEQKETEIETQEQRVQELEDAVATLTETVEGLERDLEQYADHIGEANEEVTKMKKSDEDKQARIDRCEIARTELINSRDAAWKALRELERDYEKAIKERDQAIIDLHRCNDELEHLQARYNDLEVAHEQCCDTEKLQEDLNRDLTSLDVEIKDLRARLKRKDDEHEQTNKDFARATMENERLRKETTARHKRRSPRRPETPLPPHGTTLDDELSTSDHRSDAPESGPPEEAYELETKSITSAANLTAHEQSPIKARRTSQESYNSRYREPTPPPAESEQTQLSTTDNDKEHGLEADAPSSTSPVATLRPASTYTTATTQTESSESDLASQPAATVENVTLIESIDRNLASQPAAYVDSSTRTAAPSTTDDNSIQTDSSDTNLVPQPTATIDSSIQTTAPSITDGNSTPTETPPTAVDAATQTMKLPRAVYQHYERIRRHVLPKFRDNATQTENPLPNSADKGSQSFTFSMRRPTPMPTPIIRDIAPIAPLPQTTTTVDHSTQTTPPQSTLTVNRSTQTTPVANSSTNLLNLLPSSLTTLSPLSKFLLLLLLALVSYFIRDYISLRTTRHALLSANDLTRQSIISLRAAGLRGNGLYTFFGEGGSSWLACLLGDEAAARSVWSLEKWLGIKRGFLG